MDASLHGIETVPGAPTARPRRWMVVLVCVYMLIVFPIFTILTPIGVFLAIRRSGVAMEDPLVRHAIRAIEVETVLRVFLSVYTMYAGLKLWQMSRNALQTVQSCLIVLLVYQVSFSATTRLVFGRTLQEAALTFLFNFLSTPAIFIIISYLYLRRFKSKGSLGLNGKLDKSW